MKINKGRTVIQFIKYLYSEWESDLPIDERMAYCFHLIVNWVQFCERKPKQEMFVNEIENKKRTDFLYTPHGKDKYIEHEKAWQEAEKKVIFCPDRIKDCNGLDVHTKDFYIGRYIISFYDDGDIILIIDESYEHKINSLDDIFRLTNGELEIKNVEL
jgi:hypothetical protein